MDVVRELALEADVLIENFRPGLMRELGLALDDLRTRNPRLITCSLTALTTPPRRRRGRYDIIVQALCGLMSVTGESGGKPVKAGVALLDVVTGLQAAIGTLAALQERERTGRGRHVSVALFDASVAAMVNQAANTLIGGIVPAALGTAHPNIVPYQAFHVGSPVHPRGRQRPVVPANVRGRGPPGVDRRPQFATNQDRVVHRDDLTALLGEAFAARPAAGGWRRSRRRPLPCSPIRTMDEVFDSPEGAVLVDVVNDPAHGGSLRLVTNPLRFDGERLPTEGRRRRSTPTPTRRSGGDATARGRPALQRLGGSAGRVGDPRPSSGRPRVAVGVPAGALRSSRRAIDRRGAIGADPDHPEGARGPG